MISELDRRLDEIDCQALLVVASSSRDVYLAPFLGKAKIGESFLIAGRGGRPKLGYFSPMERVEAAAAADGASFDLLTPEELDVARLMRLGTLPEALWADVLGQAFFRSGFNPGRVALAGCAPSGRMHAMCARLEREGFSFVPGEMLVARCSRAKSLPAIDQIRRVSQGVAATFRHVARLLAAAEIQGDILTLGGEPLAVGRLRDEIARQLARFGLEQPEGQIVAPGEEGAVPHSTGTDSRILRAQESLVIDLFPRDFFFSDCTRTFCVGPAPTELVRAHADCAAALALAENQARDGASGFSIHQAVCDLFKAHGWATQIHNPNTQVGYVHGLGHGLGVEVHSLPSFREHVAPEDGQLQLGDIFTLEPGLYDPAAGWAVRLENLYLLTAKGLESLTDLPLDLDPKQWLEVV
jgi:Xaa-Pro aminopeptidase